MKDPCENCTTRKAYAKAFDMHFWGADCPYVCDRYEKYDKEKEEQIVNDCVQIGEMESEIRTVLQS